MKSVVRNNIYRELKGRDLAPFADALDGDMDCTACVVTYGPAPQSVREALGAAMTRLGHDVIWLDASAGFEADATGKRLFRCIEAIDPVVVVAADDMACDLVGRAYRVALPRDAFASVFCKRMVGFTSFEADLADPQLKQRDWALLKFLRKPGAK